MELKLRTLLRGRGLLRAAKQLAVHVGGGLAANGGVQRTMKHFRGWMLRLGEGVFKDRVGVGGMEMGLKGDLL